MTSDRMMGGCASGRCNACPVRESTEMCVLSRRGVLNLEGSHVPLSYEEGTLLFEPGRGERGIWAVASGFVALYSLDDEERGVLVRVIGPGETFGHARCFSPVRPKLRAVALTPTHCCFVPRRMVNAMVRREPDMSVAMMERLAEELCHARDTIVGVVHLSGAARLASLLVDLAERFAVFTADGAARLDLPISRRGLASATGMRAETVARALRTLQRRSLLLVDGRRLTLLDPAALAEVATRGTLKAVA